MILKRKKRVNFFLLKFEYLDAIQLVTSCSNMAFRWNCIYQDRNEQWMKHFLENSPLDMHYTYSIEFFIGRSSSKIPFNVLHDLKSLEMNLSV